MTEDDNHNLRASWRKMVRDVDDVDLWGEYVGRKARIEAAGPTAAYITLEIQKIVVGELKKRGWL
jgi:hypothetical protein